MTLPRWTPADMDAQVRSGRTVLVELRAPWCTQCAPQERAVLPLLAECGNAVDIGSIDVSEHTEVSDRYHIAGLPAFLLFADGQLQHTLRGYQRTPNLRRILNRVTKH